MISEVIVRSSLSDLSTHKIVALCYQLKTKDKVRNFQIHRTKQQHDMDPQNEMRISYQNIVYQMEAGSQYSRLQGRDIQK